MIKEKIIKIEQIMSQFLVSIKFENKIVIISLSIVSLNTTFTKFKLKI